MKIISRLLCIIFVCMYMITTHTIILSDYKAEINSIGDFLEELQHASSLTEQKTEIIREQFVRFMAHVEWFAQYHNEIYRIVSFERSSDYDLDYPGKRFSRNIEKMNFVVHVICRAKDAALTNCLVSLTTIISNNLYDVEYKSTAILDKLDTDWKYDERKGKIFIACALLDAFIMYDLTVRYRDYCS